MSPGGILDAAFHMPSEAAGILKKRIWDKKSRSNALADCGQSYRHLIFRSSYCWC